MDCCFLWFFAGYRPVSFVWPSMDVGEYRAAEVIGCARAPLPLNPDPMRPSFAWVNLPPAAQQPLACLGTVWPKAHAFTPVAPRYSIWINTPVLKNFQSISLTLLNNFFFSVSNNNLNIKTWIYFLFKERIGRSRHKTLSINFAKESKPCINLNHF